MFDVWRYFCWMSYSAGLNNLRYLFLLKSQFSVLTTQLTVMIKVTTFPAHWSSLVSCFC